MRSAAAQGRVDNHDEDDAMTNGAASANPGRTPLVLLPPPQRPVQVCVLLLCASLSGCAQAIQIKSTATTNNARSRRRQLTQNSAPLLRPARARNLDQRTRPTPTPRLDLAWRGLLCHKNGLVVAIWPHPRGDRRRAQGRSCMRSALSIGSPSAAHHGPNRHHHKHKSNARHSNTHRTNANR